MFKVGCNLITGYNHFPGQIAQNSTSNDEEIDASEAPIIIHPNEPAGPAYEEKNL